MQQRVAVRAFEHLDNVARDLQAIDEAADTQLLVERCVSRAHERGTTSVIGDMVFMFLACS